MVGFLAVERYLPVMNGLFTYIEDFYFTLNFFCFSFYSANEERYSWSFPF